MSRKALIITTVSGFLPQFEMDNIKLLQGLGYEVHYASNYHIPFYGKDNSRLDGTGIIRHQIDFVRSPFKIRKNLIVFAQMRKLEKQKNFSIVHCHTPMGGLMGRVVFGIFGKRKTKILYTAHGFHFFQGASLKNWIFYYPVEKFLSRWTDTLITINKEDYHRAKTSFHAEKTEYVPGVGIDWEKYQKQNIRTKKREELEIGTDKIVLLSVGELNRGKNHGVIIESLKLLEDKNIFYCICGAGEKEKELKNLANRLGVGKQVKFLGYRKDMDEIYKMADIFVFPSFREGLPVSLMEAMASGLPCIVSNIRGNRDLIKDGVNGYLCYSNQAHEYVSLIKKLLNSKVIQKILGEKAETEVKKYERDKIRKRMKVIYSRTIR